MPRLSVLKFVFALAIAVPVLTVGSIQPTNPVTAHEWGTFTSVAGANGESVSWAPLEASADLPCFVHRIGSGYGKYVAGLVRMETPVDYFYAQSPTKISVHVDFPTGTITEWYPEAINPETVGMIDWKDLSILPGTNPTLPTTRGASRYFAARATDAAPLRAGNENEKLLFYRGMANFKVPVEPALTSGGVRIHNNGAATIPLAILFENQKGRVGYQIVRDLKENALLSAPELTATPDQLRVELTGALEQAGLYPKEAAAMLETWRDSWFEDGMRVIYIMPRATVDSVLPLKVSPAPKDVQRVFVGRVEMLSAWSERIIRDAADARDAGALEKFGRFLRPFLDQIRAKGPKELLFASAYAQQVAARIGVGTAPCVQ